MGGCIALRDGPRSVQLVVRRFLEADRKRAQCFRGFLGGERRQRAGVHTPGEEDADGNIRDQVRAHRVAQPGAAFLDELGFVLVVPCGQRACARVALDLDAAVVPAECMPGQELANVLEDRERPRHDVEREERLECVEVDLPFRQRVELGRERQLALDVAVIERLDAEPVARQHESPLARVPHRDREHAAKAFP